MLDVLAEVIYRYPTHIVAQHQALLDALLPNLLYPRPLVRKRAVLALGACGPPRASTRTSGGSCHPTGASSTGPDQRLSALPRAMLDAYRSQATWSRRWPTRPSLCWRTISSPRRARPPSPTTCARSSHASARLRACELALVRCRAPPRCSLFAGAAPRASDALAVLRRHSGKRIGKYLAALVPLTLDNIRRDDDLLRENCFQVRLDRAPACPPTRIA